MSLKIGTPFIWKRGNSMGVDAIVSKVKRNPDGDVEVGCQVGRSILWSDLATVEAMVDRDRKTKILSVAEANKVLAGESDLDEEDTGKKNTEDSEDTEDDDETG